MKKENKFELTKNEKHLFLFDELVILCNLSNTVMDVCVDDLQRVSRGDQNGKMPSTMMTNCEEIFPKEILNRSVVD